MLLTAAPAGWAIGSVIWLLYAHPAGATQAPLLSARLSGVNVREAARFDRPDAVLAQAITTPLFALTSGPGAVAEVALRLDGLVHSPARVAALLSINGAPSDWLDLGASRDGVTLEDVTSNKVVVDTATGLREIILGQTPATADGAAAPSGLRSPPPPASAPGMPR
jgi:hypothetical protein